MARLDLKGMKIGGVYEAEQNDAGTFTRTVRVPKIRHSDFTYGGIYSWDVHAYILA